MKAEIRPNVVTHIKRQRKPLRNGIDHGAQVDGALMSLYGVMDVRGQDFRADVHAAIEPVRSIPDSAFRRRPGVDIPSFVVNVPGPDPDRERTHEITLLRHGPGDHELRTQGDSIRVIEEDKRVTVTLYKKDSDAEPQQEPYTPLRTRTVRTRARRQQAPIAEVRGEYRTTDGANRLPADLVKDIKLAAEREAAAKRAARQQSTQAA